jgi:type II restriction/modification system DNA methylase subunit YeeA
MAARLADTFQSSMDKERRHAIGAHFTSEADIQKVVLPTIVDPWQERIDRADTLRDLEALTREIRSFRVLDPACGSGNFCTGPSNARAIIR